MSSKMLRSDAIGAAKDADGTARPRSAERSHTTTATGLGPGRPSSQSPRATLQVLDSRRIRAGPARASSRRTVLADSRGANARHRQTALRRMAHRTLHSSSYFSRTPQRHSSGAGLLSEGERLGSGETNSRHIRPCDNASWRLHGHSSRSATATTVQRLRYACEPHSSNR
jgi:hypothetical protein